MAKKYLEQLTALMARIRVDELDRAEIECRHFFSGAAVYASNRICISLTPVGFAIKLPEQYRTTLLKRRGAKPLRYFPKGPIKKDYVVLPRTMLSDINALRRLVRISVANAASAPKLPTRRPVS
jgi:hypothetical protein